MFVLLHIWKKAFDVKPKIHNIKSKLDESIRIAFLGNTIVLFTVLLSGWSGHLNAMSVFPGLIAVNAEWAARLVLLDDDVVKKAFRFTMGHEMTHQSGDYMFLEAFTKDRRFVNWVNEVRADYGGAKLAFAGNVNEALSAIRYKAQDYLDDKDHQTHPSWKRREEYLNVRLFDNALINRIADDAGCSNKALIEKVCNHFEPIILKED